MDEFEKVSIGTMESALQHLQETNKRLAMITALALIIAGVMFCSLMYFLTNYEIVTQDVTIDSHEGTANYIGNDGDIINGSDQGENNNSAEEESQ